MHSFLLKKKKNHLIIVKLYLQVPVLKAIFPNGVAQPRVKALGYVLLFVAT